MDSASAEPKNRKPPKLQNRLAPNGASLFCIHKAARIYSAACTSYLSSISSG